MHENSDLQENENDQSIPQNEEYEEPGPQEKDVQATSQEQPLASVTEQTSLVSIYVSDEGIEDAGTLLKAWVPDIPLSIIVVTSKESQVSYLKEQLGDLDTFTLSIVTESTNISAGHIYVIAPDVTCKYQDATLAISNETQAEHIPGEAFLTTYGRALRQRALLLFFVESLADYASIIKLLSSCYSSIIHHSTEDKKAVGLTEISFGHLFDRSSSLEEAAVYTQRFIESFKLNTISELENNPQSISYVQHITSILEDRTSSTFSHINPGYILLHVYQRLRIHGFSSIHQYVEKLASSSEEVNHIAKRIAIKNSFFFNDLKSLRVIAKTVIPSLVKEAGPEHVIRVWVPGCSTGEDVLSLSMLIHEHAESVQTSNNVRLLGTENNEHILKFARNPQYTASVLSSIPNIIKQKFFVEKEEFSEYEGSFLEQCHYSLLSPTTGAPYTNLDIIYCKDVLTTLTAKARKTLLKYFTEALSPKGILVLGSNETHYRDLPFFMPVKNQPFIFKPIRATIKDPSKGQHINLFKNQESAGANVPKTEVPHPNTGEIEKDNIHALHRDLLLQIQAPVSLMIRADFTIIDHIGNVGRFIAWPNNGRTQNMLEAFPREVQDDLRFAVNQVLKSQIALKSRPLKTDYEGIFRDFRLQVHPINLEDSENSLIQIIFLEVTEATDAKNAATPSISAMEIVEEKNEEELDELKAELDETQEKLRVVSGLLKDSKELLKKAKTREQEAIEKAANINVSEEHEKIQRQNEDLRSTNTELLELNRDLVRRIEELRRNMNRKLKEMEATKAQEDAKAPKEDNNTSSLNKNLELLLPKRHEVRTSLTSIIGFADLLADRIVDKDNRELARYIGKSGHRLSENLAPLLNMDFQDNPAAQPSGEDRKAEQDDLVSSNRVLVVEDSEATRRLLTLVLSDKFECEVAADGSEAIEKAEKELFKAVLLDIDLGKGPNGIDVLDHLRQKNYYRTVPFMAVTSMATPQDRSMLLRKGFDAFVPKPFQKVQLLSTLDKIIDNSGMIA